MKKGHLTRHNVFPAYAGVSLFGAVLESRRLGLPRLRGGEPLSPQSAWDIPSSSPPTRG